VAINPPSDIVLDVARAADPEAYRAAVDRLARLRAAAPSDQVFMLPAVQPPTAPNTTAPGPEASVDRSLSAPRSADRRARLDPYGQFEAFVLQNFLESMLPKEATNVFGKGSAGEFWRSMLAEKLGGELARSGQIGIAQRLAKGPVATSQPSTSGPAPGPVHATILGNVQGATASPSPADEIGANAPTANERS